MTVTAKDISAAFQENEAKAKLAYDGKTVIVSGVVKDIDLTIGDSPVIKLKGSGEQYGMGVNKEGKMTDVSISGLTTQVAATIDKGNSMSFQCGSVDEILGGATLNDCTVAK